MSMTGDYANRSDLRNPATRRVTFTGQTYGESAAQQRAQDVVPAGGSPQDVAAQEAAAARPRPRPGARPFNRPTERPDEPLTAGADFGPGPSAIGAGITPRVVAEDDLQMQLEALYRRYPTEGVRLLLQRMRDTKMRRGRIG